MLTKVDISNRAIELARNEYNRALSSQNLFQMAEMKKLIRMLQDIRDHF